MKKFPVTFPSRRLLLAFVKTVSMLQRVLEPEGGRVRNVEEENRVDKSSRNLVVRRRLGF